MIVGMIEKLCLKCGEVKACADFPAKRGKPVSPCRACTRLVIAAWHKAHKDRVGEIKTNYRRRNADKLNASARNRYWQDHELTRAKRNARQSRYRRENPELHRAHLAKRRKRLRSDGDNFTASDVSRLLTSQCGRCAEPSCRSSLKKGYHVDHVMPLALGGSNNAGNIQLLCPACNIRKGRRHPIEWANLNGRLF